MPPHPRHRPIQHTVLLVLGVTVIAVLYWVSATGGHSYSQLISLPQAFAASYAQGWSGLFESDISASPTGPMVGAMYLMLAIYLAVRDGAARLVVASLSIFLPVLSVGLLGAVLAPIGVLFLFHMTAGTFDGEAYEEGIAVLAPLGAWFWLWALVAVKQFRTMRRATHEPQTRDAG